MNPSENSFTEAPDNDADHPREACGIFGIHSHREAAKLTYFGLYALQHRGQESAGIAVARENRIDCHKGMGLVPEVFDAPSLEWLDARDRKSVV